MSWLLSSKFLWRLFRFSLRDFISSFDCLLFMMSGCSLFFLLRILSLSCVTIWLSSSSVLPLTMSTLPLFLVSSCISISLLLNPMMLYLCSNSLRFFFTCLYCVFSIDSVLMRIYSSYCSVLSSVLLWCTWLCWLLVVCWLVVVLCFDRCWLTVSSSCSSWLISFYWLSLFVCMTLIIYL